jgi:hypothetical protein
MMDARLGQDLVEVRAPHAPSEDGALLVHGVHHARHGEVDTEDRLAGDDVVDVDVADRCTDDIELARVLERHGLGIGRSDLGRALGEGAVPQATPARTVMHDAGVGLELGGGNAPRLGRGLHQHPPGRGSGAPHGEPVGRHSRAATRELPLVQRGVEPGLFDRDGRPVDIQLVRDQHRQHGLHALADLGFCAINVTVPSGSILTCPFGTKSTAEATASRTPKKSK